MRWPHRFWSLCLPSVLWIAVAGCSNAGSRWMIPSTAAQALQAVPGTATLVVMRPGDGGRRIRFTLIDDRGAFLGQPLAESYYALRLPAGSYRLVAWAAAESLVGGSESAVMVELHVQADRTYYLLAERHTGFWRSGMELTPVRRGDANFALVHEWLAASTPHLVDLAGGQRNIDASRAAIVRKLAEANDGWAALSAADRAARTLRPGDGTNLEPRFWEQPHD